MIWELQLVTRDFEIITRVFELTTRDFVLKPVTRDFELVNKFEAVTRVSKLVLLGLNSCFQALS